MLIRNFGHLWQRKYINYGRPRVRGHLTGYLNKSWEIDFRDQIGIYVLYDKDFLPVYLGQVGRSTGLLRRLSEHETDHLWNRWDNFSWFGLRRVNKDGTLSLFDNVDKMFRVRGFKLLNQIEGALLTALEPKLNKQGARWIDDVEEYYQLVDDEKRDIELIDVLDGHARIEKSIADLGKKIAKLK